MKKLGKFVVFEGVNGAGKTTLIKALLERLPQYGLAVRETSEPHNRDLVKKRIADGMDPAEAYTRDRERHHDELLNQLLSCDVLLCSRYYLSTIVYQMRTSAPDLIVPHAARYIQPDLWAVMTVPEAQALERITARDGEAKQSLEDLRKIDQQYLMSGTVLADNCSHAHFMGLDGTQTISRLTDIMSAAILRLVQR